MAVTMVPGSFTNEYRGLSNDAKPTANVPNGSVFKVIDTGSRYMFDAENSRWMPQYIQSLSGTGIGGAGGIYYKTTAEWNSESSLVTERGALYIYSDYQTITDQNENVTVYPNIKIGDGASTLSAIPFIVSGSVKDLDFEDYVPTIVETLEAQNRLVSDSDREKWDQIGNINVLLENI